MISGFHLGNAVAGRVRDVRRTRFKRGVLSNLRREPSEAAVGKSTLLSRLRRKSGRVTRTPRKKSSTPVFSKKPAGGSTRTKGKGSGLLGSFRKKTALKRKGSGFFGSFRRKKTGGANTKSRSLFGSIRKKTITTRRRSGAPSNSSASRPSRGRKTGFLSSLRRKSTGAGRRTRKRFSYK